MPTYQLLVNDDRCEAPTLVLCEAIADGHAQARAKELLLRSQHHHCVEVYVGERLLASVRRPLRAAASPRQNDGPWIA